MADAFGAGAVTGGRRRLRRPGRLSTDVGINRVIGLGVARPADEGRPRSHRRGLRARCATRSRSRPARARRSSRPWLRRARLRARRRRGSSSSARPIRRRPAETELRVERIGAERAARFTAVLAAGFGLAPAVTAMLAHLPGLPGWGWYLAYDGDLPGGVRSRVRARRSRLAGAGGDAARAPPPRRPVARSRRRGSPRRHAAGATVVVTETGEAVPGRPGASYRNILRAGFEPAYVRPNYVSNPVPGTHPSAVTPA